jgi:hypothetical protein
VWLSAEPEEVTFDHEFLFQENAANSRAYRIASKLGLLTDDQQGFLNLFCADTLPTPGESQTYLDNAFYRAAFELVAEGILNSKTVRPSVEKFCLSEEMLRAWRPDSGYKRQCVEIDLGAVKGTRASGGAFTPPYIRPSAPNIEAPPSGESSS